MLPLAVPWFLLSILIFSIISFLRKKWKIGIFLLIFCFIINCYTECLPIRVFANSEKINGRCIKVMCFNINGATSDSNDRVPEIINIITHNTPDLIFIAEFPSDEQYLDSVLRVDYPYSSRGYGHSHYFYSKYPLGKQDKLKEGENGVGVYKCTMEIDSISYVLYGCHFTSNNYTKDRQYHTPDSIVTHKDLLKYLADIRRAYKARSRESDFLVGDFKDNNNITIVLGDFNDVGGSYTIRNIESVGYKDAWWEGGCGYGATIHSPVPYRIDHILYSGGVKLKSIKVIDSNGISDHDALCAMFSL